MRLLINAIPLLGEESGIGNYTRHISVGLQADPVNFDLTFFYGYLSKKLRFAPQNGAHSWLGNLKGLAKKGTLPRRIAKKAMHLGFMAANIIRPRNWDCYFEPNFVLLPRLRAAHTVITIHDFSCFLYPQWHPIERVRYMEKYFWQSVDRASHLITVSQAIKNEAATIYGIKPERITAIPNGVDHASYYPRAKEELAALRKRYSLPENFILYVGAVEPRKNLCNLITAHARLPRALRNRFPLVIIGSQGWHNDDALELIAKEKAHTRILGYVPQRELPAFYSAATIFAYPSWYEGFGLPVVEAMACGCPTLTSDAAALKEICAGAGVCVAPGDVEDMTQKIRGLLEDDKARSEAGQAGIRRAMQFGWDKAAKSHMRVFEQLT